MEFEQVYLSLADLFPQIDPRALRAVAIEHSKDIDAAVMAVLDEIVPFFTVRPASSSPLTCGVSISESFYGALVGAPDGRQQSSGDADAGLNERMYDAYDGHHVEDKIYELTLPEKTHESRVHMCADVHSPSEPVVLIDENRADTLQIEISGEPQTHETISGGKRPESSIKISSDSITQHTVGISQETGMGISKKTNLHQENEDVAREILLEKYFAEENIAGEIHLEKSFAEENNETSLSTVDNVTVRPSESIEVSVMQKSNSENTNACLSADDESTLNATMSHSSQIHIIDLIEELITDARNNKKTLFTEMESILNLTRQVELKEQAAEEAKAEAEVGGMDTLDKVDELKRMLQYAKEANDMHAGEVYGEKAILVTELRELQSRVYSLSDERDKSLAIMDELRQSLEARLIAAENDIKSSDQEKQEKVITARKSLNGQELIMEKVVQESKILKQQAEENAKLQEFLVDRGHVVDALQGEMAVICQDVRLLKEKCDARVPFIKSLISSHTSFILASSHSSLKTSVPDQDQDQDQVQATPVGECSISEAQDNTDHEEEEAAAAASEDDRKALQDEGWEFFVDAEMVDCVS